MLAASSGVKLIMAPMDMQLIMESIGKEADQVVRAEPMSPAVEGQFKSTLEEAVQGAISWSSRRQVVAPHDMAVLARRDQGLQTKYQQAKHRVDGRPNVELPHLTAQLLTQASDTSGNFQMLVMCCGGRSWSDGMRGINRVMIGGAINFNQKVLKVYQENFDHPAALLDMLEVDEVVDQVKKWGQFNIAQMSIPCTGFHGQARGWRHQGHG
jgi:hypothetical protein